MHVTLFLVFVQVHCSIPASVVDQERKLIEETVAAECCPETVRRIRETGAQVVSKTLPTPLQFLLVWYSIVHVWYM